MNLKRNVGRTECWLRFAAGLLLILLGLFSEPIGMLLYLLGGLSLLTSIIGFCPLYALRDDLRRQ